MIHWIYIETLSCIYLFRNSSVCIKSGYGLHLYHILMYIKKLRYDDWLHHGLMIFVALPIGNYFGPTKLLSHSMFYTTGLPGMVDYTCLSLVRNKKMQRLTEKKINRYLNTYIRNPGCTIHAYITLISLMAYHTTTNIANTTYNNNIKYYNMFAICCNSI